MFRKVKLTSQAQPTREGAGVHLKRVFGFNDEELFDPFLLLDDFRSDNPQYYIKGFPWHPHRGIETITYVLSGDVEHGDSLGNQGIISSGDVQWMTAGSGIIHQEMPQGDDQGRMYGFQLWANLPAKEKMTSPKYRDVKANQIPVVALASGVKIKVIAGTFEDTTGPVGDVVIEPQYFDCSMTAETAFRMDTSPDHTVLIYVYGGSGQTADISIENTTLVLYDEGNAIELLSGSKGLRFLFVSGKPLKEPIAWQGPIVMNSEEELEQAFREYQEGTFIKE